MFIRGIRICLVLVVCAVTLRASEDSVTVRLLRRGDVPQATRPLLPEAGWAVQLRPQRDTQRFWEARGEFVHVLSNVSETCAKDVAAYVELYTGQVMPVLQEMLGREDGKTVPIRMHVYKDKEDAPRWWVYEKHGYHVWHDPEQWSVHWVLDTGAESADVRVAGDALPDVRYHLVRMLMRRFLPAHRFVEDSFTSTRLNFHYAPMRTVTQTGGSQAVKEDRLAGGLPGGHPAMAHIRAFREKQASEWLHALDEWREELGLTETNAMPDFDMLREQMRAIRGTQSIMHQLRGHQRGLDMAQRNEMFDRLLKLQVKGEGDAEDKDRTPNALYKAWDTEFTSWRKDAASWNTLDVEERDSLIARLWALLRFWDRALEEDAHAATGMLATGRRLHELPVRRHAALHPRQTVPPTFEEGAGALLGKAWDPYLKPEANLAYAQVAFNPLLLVRAHHPAFDPLQTYDPYAPESALLEPAEEEDPRAAWLDSKTLVEYGAFHGAYQLNTEAQGFLLLSFLLNDTQGQAFLQDLVFSMKHAGRFHRYEELDAAWQAYLERGVLRTVGGNGMDAESFFATYTTIEDPALDQVDFTVEPSWSVLADHPLMRGTWMTGQTRIRVRQTSNRLSIFGYAENGQMAFSGRATIHPDGMLDGQVQYHRDNRTEPLRGRLAPDGESLHPAREVEGILQTPWMRVR